MSKIKLMVGGSLADDASAFVQAWQKAARGEKIRERTLAFESWDMLSKVLTTERYRLLKHIHAHPEPSISSLARSLKRHYRRVHADVAALETAGLLSRLEGGLHATADNLTAHIRL